MVMYFLIMNQARFSYDFKKKTYLVVASILIVFLYLFVDLSEFPDVPIYEYVYENITHNGIISLSFDNVELDFEKGYMWLNVLLNTISNDFFALRLSLIIFISIILSKAIYDYSNITWMSFIQFLCILLYPTIYTLRQSFAIFIFLFSVKYIINRNFFKYLICIAIAFLFHKTSIVCLILYFIYPLKINLRNLLLFFLCTIAIMISLSTVLSIIGLYINDVNAYILEDGDTSSIRQLIIPFLVLFSSLFFNRKDLNSERRDNQLFFWMVIVNCGFSIMYYFSTEFNQFYRLNYYFNLGTIFLIPNTLSTIKNKYTKNSMIFLWTSFWIAYICILINMQYGL